jgi:hypothetical protein
MTRIAAPPARFPDSDGPRQVSKFEFNLLRILRFFVGHFPAEQAVRLLRESLPRPECLSLSAVELVQDTLAKGCILFLVRQGGWRNDRYLRNGHPIAGRVWDRIPLNERTLVFSRAVLEFLIWATAEKVHETKTPWDTTANQLTAADELFFWLVLNSIRFDPDLLASLRKKEAFRLNPFCWVCFPGDLVGNDNFEAPNFTPLFEGVRAAILECLQCYLTERWLQSERKKGQVGEWKKLRQQGQAEFVALRTFLEAAGRAKRPDLARFVLRTNATLLSTDLTPAFWTSGLQGSGPLRLADRLETQRAALAVPRQMEVLEAWQNHARTVGYFDDDYQATQMWKAEWEALHGDLIVSRARAVIQMLEPLGGATLRAQSADRGETAHDDHPEGSTE